MHLILEQVLLLHFKGILVLIKYEIAFYFCQQKHAMYFTVNLNTVLMLPRYLADFRADL